MLGSRVFFWVLDPRAWRADNLKLMATTMRKSPATPSAQRLAAQQAEELAHVLQSFAATLLTLEKSDLAKGRQAPTPRNWWKVQAGRFQNDATFSDFVVQVQAARKREG